jgi:hypothetical protein
MTTLLPPRAGPPLPPAGRPLPGRLAPRGSRGQSLPAPRANPLLALRATPGFPLAAAWVTQS